MAFLYRWVCCSHCRCGFQVARSHFIDFSIFCDMHDWKMLLYVLQRPDVSNVDAVSDGFRVQGIRQKAERERARVSEGQGVPAAGVRHSVLPRA
jgi:hypothetical protein